jgi:hypothetical protein
LVADSGNPALTGGYINIDENVTDELIDAVFEAVAALRRAVP